MDIHVVPTNNKHIEADTCWCEPGVERYENGNRIIIHRGDN